MNLAFLALILIPPSFLPPFLPYLCPPRGWSSSSRGRRPRWRGEAAPSPATARPTSGEASASPKSETCLGGGDSQWLRNDEDEMLISGKRDRCNERGETETILSVHSLRNVVFFVSVEVDTFSFSPRSLERLVDRQAVHPRDKNAHIIESFYCFPTF